jgi:tripartite-type tricarboxylate transporter receptor subunit TctC
MKLLQAIVGLSIALCGLAHGEYPEKSIRMVNPYPPGSPVEFIGRLVSERLSKAWGKPVLLESRSGAGGTIGADFVAKSAPDGYTLLVTTPSTLAVAPALYKVLPYDPIRDFAPIWSITSSGLVVVINPKLPAHTLGEFIQYVRSNPGKVAYASSGVGTTQHLAGEQFKVRTGLDLLHVPYKGGAPASTDLMAGHVQVMFDSLTNVLGAVRDGRLRALAVLRAKRSNAMPDVPTAAEAGVNGVEQPGWIGVFAPAATPPEIIARLVSTTTREMADPEVMARMVASGNDSPVSGAELGRRLVEDKALFAEIVKKAGIKPE